MIAKYKNEYFQCYMREFNVILISAKEREGFRKIYSSDRRKLLRCEKIISLENTEESRNITEIIDVEFQGKWKNRWLPISINKEEKTGTIIFWDNVETRRRLYGNPAAYAEKHNFSPFVSNNNVVRAWQKTLSLDDFTGLRAKMTLYLYGGKEEIVSLTKDETIEMYQRLVIDIENIKS